MNRRQSTNYKLDAIINSKNNDQDEEEEVKNVERNAKSRLRRTSLYGGGARTRIPKVKLSNKIGLSPYQLTDVLANDNSKEPKKFETSIPPGAHMDQFRMVGNLTQKSFNDPDRICYNSTTMLEGLHTIAQPPWYFGNTNKTTPADTNMLIAAARYGFRGSKNIQQYNTNPYEVPSKTRTEYTPKFLDNGDYINEWVPPIIAAAAQSVNGIETPKTWPENTEYVHGYPLKKLPKSWRYKRETTVDLAERPKTSEGLQTLQKSISQQDDLLREYSRLESSNTFQSLPQTVQATFGTTWKEKVDKLANNTLKYNLTRTKPSYEAHTLLDPSDVIKYSGTTAMIVHSQTTDELKFRIRMDRSKAKTNTPYALKWQHIGLHLRNIILNVKRNTTFDDAMEIICSTLEREAIAAGSSTTLSRLTFITACGKISYFEGMSAKQLSLLYSLFDPMKKNHMRYVEILNLLTLLDKPMQSPYEKLQALWLLNTAYGQDRNVLDMCLEILSSCCTSLQEQTLISNLFRDEFRPRCYDMSMKHAAGEKSVAPSAFNSAVVSRVGTTEGSSRQTSARAITSAPRSGRLNTAQSTATTSSNGADDAMLMIEEENAMAALTLANNNNNATKKSTLSIQPQYNICEHYLNPITFIKVLKQCPSLVTVFDTQLSYQLVAFYGKDERYKVEIEEVEENHDFTWIFKQRGEKPKKDVFSLN